MRKASILVSMLVVIQTSQGQDNQDATISGFVYDASNGEALIGTNVYLDGTQIGSSTNTSGYYVIPHIPAGAHTLIVHYIGYKPYHQKISLAPGDQKTVSVNLEQQDIYLENVVVTGEAIPAAERLFAKQISELKISPQQLKQIPQVAETDLLRSLQMLPGILPVSDFSSALYVRGGTPDQNLYLMDGTDVYNPEHAFGFFSTFNTDAIKQVDISKGGFSAKYGGRLSSVLNVTNLDGNREHFEATASVSLLSVKGTVQTPLGKIGSLSGSLRRTYFDKTIAPFIYNAPKYYFLDGNIKAFFDINNKNKLTVSGYGSIDKLSLIFNPEAQNEAGAKYDWGNRTGSIRWTRIFSPQLFANFWVTGSHFDSDADFSQTFDQVYTEKNFITDISFKGDLEYYFSDSFNAGLGFEQKNLHLIFRHQSESDIIDIETRPKHFAAYILGNWQPSYQLVIEAGLRFNYFDSDQNFENWAPRLSAKFRLTESVNLKAAGGVYYQYLHRVPKTFIADNWISSNIQQGESSSKHAILGISKDFSNFQIEIEAYYKNFKNIYAFNHNYQVDITPDRFEGEVPIYTQTTGIFNRGDGNSKGIEFLLRKDYGILTGWVGYSLMLTEATFDGINQGKAFAPRQDRTHVLNLVGNLDWKNFKRSLRGEAPTRHRSNWRIGFIFSYTSGQPITLPGSSYFVNTAPDWDFESPEAYPAAINEMRLPPYIRLDVSFTYEKHYKSWSIFPYVQVFNVWNRKNVWYLDYDVLGNPAGSIPLNSTIKTVGMFPIVPTIGVNFEFGASR